MKLLFLLLTFITHLVFAENINDKNINDNIFAEFFTAKELKTFQEEAEQISSQSFNLSTSLNKFTKEELKISLIFMFLTQANPNLNVIKFKEITSLYLFSINIPKKDAISKMIEEYVLNLQVTDENFNQKMPEIEEMIWFFLITENHNLISFLNDKKLKVQDFIEIIKQKKDWDFFKNLIYSKEDEISGILWQGKVTKALPLIENINNNNLKEIFYARVFFQTKNPKYADFAKKAVEKNDFTDDGFVYDYIKYLAKTEHYQEALVLLNKVQIKPSSPYFNKFWNLVEELFRYYVTEAQYYNAFELLSKMEVSEEVNFPIFLRAKSLSGFLALRFLKDPKMAITFFEAIYNSKYASVYAKSRASYFISKSYKALKNKSAEKKWLIISSKYINTFYGMLAIDELNQIEPVLFFGTFNYTQSKIEENLKRRNEIHKFYFDEYFTRYYEKSQINTKQALKELKENTSFKVGLLLLFSGYQADANRFFALSTNYMSFNDVKLAFDLLNFYLTKVNDSSKTLILNTFASKASNQGVILVESYPLLDFIVNEKNIYPNPLIHAIIKQESNFTIRAISGPGAIGLMQVIPTTGKIVTRSANIEFNIHRLKNDYKYNIQIGSYYLDIVLNRFNQSYPFALIGYNAGPNRVSSWQKRYLEPKNLDEMLDFIELIPFKETREYVLRVMENEVIYNYLIEHHLSGSLLPLEKKDNDFNEFLRQNVQPQKVNFKQEQKQIKNEKTSNLKPTPKK